MYVNKKKISVTLGMIKVKIIVWGILGSIFLLSLMGSLLDKNIDKYGAGFRISVIVLVAICALFIVLNVLKRIKIMSAYRISNAFENDSDGVMKISEIANSVHMPVPKLEKYLLWLLNNNYLINCRFDERNQSNIILTDVNSAQTNQFVVMECVSCGARIQARPGQGVKCPSCGTFIAPN